LSGHKDHVVERYRICIVVTSDSVFKGLKRDELRPLVDEELGKCDGAILTHYTVLPNDYSIIKKELEHLCHSCDIIVVTGGTGISKRDVSVDILREIGDIELPGFGEEFRRRSSMHIGERALLSRASAFVIRGKCALFAVPGNPEAFRVFIEIVCPIAKHLVYELHR